MDYFRDLVRFLFYVGVFFLCPAGGLYAIAELMGNMIREPGSKNILLFLAVLLLFIFGIKHVVMKAFNEMQGTAEKSFHR